MIRFLFSFDEKDLKILRPNSFKFGSLLDQAIQRTAMEIRNTAVTSIQRGARSGRIYKRRSIVHQASGAGEYPKSDTGNLASHIRVDSRYLEADIGTDVVYGQFLETGVRGNGKAGDGWRMKPRPWLAPSVETNRQRWLDGINVALEKAFKP